MSAEAYLARARELFQALDVGKIREAARVLADALATGHTAFAFGASHAFIVVEELVYRAGGLMLINPIYPHGMNVGVRPLTLTSHLERVVGLGRELLANSAARSGDVLILHSNSGRNPATIDMALLARERGIRTIAITALSYRGREVSRHPCGKLLAELCDVVIDNAVPYGDAAVELPGLETRVGPLSSLAGVAIANALVAETVRLLWERGVEPPVFQSANVTGGEAHNARLLERYRERIHYL
ncbi:MAG: SIS domain-containing protein [Verrucomicrobiae bacterium]|nr:SIS domain-containing protein [Verrucomicrobiae bacterium]